LAVVAPTVPLILMDAVPVKLVTVPLDGVPKAPPLTTGEPAVPTLTAKAVATPVPRPETPVEIGRPVALVNVALDGVPNAGVTKVGEFDNTTFVVPVLVVTPVPPLATGNAVPDKLIANVPVVVTGEPVIDKNAGTVAATLVTVPVPALTLTVTSSPELVAVTVAPTKLMFLTPVEIEVPSS
jgi:hypothetical protein